MTHHSPNPGASVSFIPTALLVIALSIAGSATAASGVSPTASNFWDMVIILVVFAATAGSAVLPIAAIRRWNRNWKIVAALPLLALVVWLLLIALSKQIEPQSHQLWKLEVFAWAMLNMIYMVTVMTAKQMFARKDSEDAAKE